jgi:hypothetical protein
VKVALPVVRGLWICTALHRVRAARSRTFAAFPGRGAYWGERTMGGHRAEAQWPPKGLARTGAIVRSRPERLRRAVRAVCVVRS